MTVWRELHAYRHYAWAGRSGCADRPTVLVRVRRVWNRSERASSWENQGWLWVSFVIQSSSRIQVPVYTHPFTLHLRCYPPHANTLPSSTCTQITILFAQLPHVRKTYTSCRSCSPFCRTRARARSTGITQLEQDLAKLTTFIRHLDILPLYTQCLIFVYQKSWGFGAQHRYLCMLITQDHESIPHPMLLQLQSNCPIVHVNFSVSSCRSVP